jgi:hypothetical protein
VKTENWQEKNENKEIGGKIQWNREHDKIVQYFPHCYGTTFRPKKPFWWVLDMDKILAKDKNDWLNAWIYVIARKINLSLYITMDKFPTTIKNV